MHAFWCTGVIATAPTRLPIQIGGTPLLADLASPVERQQLAVDAQNAFGCIDVLVNDAGFGWSGPLTEMSVDEIRRLIEVDLVAAIELTHAVLPGMLERRAR